MIWQDLPVSHMSALLRTYLVQVHLTSIVPHTFVQALAPFPMPRHHDGNLQNQQTHRRTFATGQFEEPPPRMKRLLSTASYI